MDLCVFWCRQCLHLCLKQCLMNNNSHCFPAKSSSELKFLGSLPLSLWELSRPILYAQEFQFNLVNLGIELNQPEPLYLWRFIYHWIMQPNRGRRLNRSQYANCSFIYYCHINKVDRVELIHLLTIYSLAIRYNFTISWAHSLTNFIRIPSIASFLITFHPVLVMCKILEKDGLKRHERISWETRVSLNRTRSNKVKSASLQRPTEKRSKSPRSQEALFCHV